MFWIGFGAGTAASFLIIIIAIAILANRLAKERSETTEVLKEYWKESVENQRIQCCVLENIEQSIRNK